MRRVKIYSVKLVVPRGFRQKYEGTTKSKDGNIEAIIPTNYIDAILKDLGFQPERRRQRFREMPANLSGKRAKEQESVPQEALPAPDGGSHE
jgi:hypothetical protein